VATSDISVAYGTCMTGSWCVGTILANLTVGQLTVEAADGQRLFSSPTATSSRSLRAVAPRASDPVHAALSTQPSSRRGVGSRRSITRDVGSEVPSLPRAPGPIF
jgi:hypothetical protein